MRQDFRLFALALLALTTFGCRDRVNREVQIAATTALYSREMWGVVVSEYARVQEDADAFSAIQRHLRRGDVVRLSVRPHRSQRFGTATYRWYAVRSGDVEGWVLGADLALYFTQGQTENAVRLLSEE